MRITHEGVFNLKTELLQLLQTLNYFDRRGTSDAITLQIKKKKKKNVCHKDMTAQFPDSCG